MLPVQITKFDHVAIAHWDVTDAVRLFSEVLGATYHDGGDETGAGFRWLQFTLPGGKVELLEPISRDGFLYRFLSRRGEGLHHVTLYVPDLAAAVPDLVSAGYEPVDVNLAHESWREAFLHPRDTRGVLIQLVETTHPDTPPRPPRPLEDFLADRPNLRLD